MSRSYTSPLRLYRCAVGLLYLFAKIINPPNLFVGKHEFENNVDGFIELTVINAEQTRRGLRCRRKGKYIPRIL
jgi:hypothetical protein